MTRSLILAAIIALGGGTAALAASPDVVIDALASCCSALAGCCGQGMPCCD